jgi:condensin-2 complex subunit H2
VQFELQNGVDYDDNCDDQDGLGWEINSAVGSSSDHHQDQQMMNKQDMMKYMTTISSPMAETMIPLLQKIQHKNTSDPWAMLDPHDVSQSKSRPINTAVTYRLPFGVNEPPSFTLRGNTKSKKRCKEARNIMEQSILESDTFSFSNLEMLSQAVREYKETLNRVKEYGEAMDFKSDLDQEMTSTFKVNPISLQSLSFGNEFLYVLESQSKIKAAEKRRLKRLELQYKNEPKEVVDANDRFHEMYADDEDNEDADNEGAAFLFEGMNDYDHDSDNCNSSDNPCHGNINSYSFQSLFDTNDKQGQTSGSGTFEDLCRAHLKEFAKGAERFAVESQLSKRVSNWQAKLENILCEEETRPEFDIQVYGNHIITKALDGLKRRQMDQKKTLGIVSMYLDIICFV